MLSNYFKIAWRNLAGQKSTAIIHILGLAMGISAAAMTVMSIAGHHTGTPLMLTIAACLVGCAAAHGRILLTAHHRHAHSLSAGQSRSLLLAPHLSAVGMTLTMAYLFAV